MVVLTLPPWSLGIVCIHTCLSGTSVWDERSWWWDVRVDEAVVRVGYFYVVRVVCLLSNVSRYLTRFMVKVGWESIVVGTASVFNTLLSTYAQIGCVLILRYKSNTIWGEPFLTVSTAYRSTSPCTASKHHCKSRWTASMWITPTWSSTTRLAPSTRIPSDKAFTWCLE